MKKEKTEVKLLVGATVTGMLLKPVISVVLTNITGTQPTLYIADFLEKLF